MDNLPKDLPESAPNGSFNPSYLDPNPVHHVDTPTAPPAPEASWEPKHHETVHITHTEKSEGRQDPPLVDLKVTNPLTYFKNWLTKLLKNQDIDIRIKIKPFATLALVGALSAVFGLGYNFGLNSAAKVLFPNSSPILHRAITIDGIVQKSSSGKYYLSDGNNVWTLTGSKSSLSDLVNKDATIKGNLTPDKNVINVSEVIPLTPIVSPSPVPSPARSASTSVASGPALYPNLTWDTTQAKTLLFTSGKRRIEQEGVYLESAALKEFPQEFINYYNNELTNAGFKQTLNSADPNGTTITYAKDDTFFTFGVKNVYSGSGGSKSLTSYKAFIEHN